MTPELAEHATEMRAQNIRSGPRTGRWHPRADWDGWLAHTQQWCKQRNREAALLGWVTRRLAERRIAA